MNESMDRAFMERAVELGRQARFWSSPNPAVGCVLAREGEVIGTGFTQPAGAAHAEVMALHSVADARDAVAYVTLEPCGHHGKTGPCTEALIAAGVSRVVVALEDPNPLVSGTGIAALRNAGVTVEVGLMAPEVERDLAGFLWRMRRGWGRITLKVATSLDGRTATASGESQWITGLLARQDVQRLRAESDVIVTGVGSVLADDCRLTLRPDELPLPDEEKARALDHAPHRMVLDSRGRTPDTAQILRGDPAMVVVAEGMVPALGSFAVRLPADEEGRIDLGAWVRYLGESAYNEILVEAGPTLSGALLAGGWVDRLVIYQAPKLLGQSARPLAALDVDVLSAAPQFAIDDVTRLGVDLRIIASPDPEALRA